MLAIACFARRTFSAEMGRAILILAQDGVASALEDELARIAIRRRALEWRGVSAAR